jgi:hypothetical protein
MLNVYCFRYFCLYKCGYILHLYFLVVYSQIPSVDQQAGIFSESYQRFLASTERLTHVFHGFPGDLQSYTW